MNKISSNDISFRSIVVPIKTKKPLVDYLNSVKSCSLKSMQGIPTEQCYKQLFNDAKNSNHHAGVKLDKIDGNVVMRFLGYSKENEEFMFKELKKIDKNTQYIKDIINDGYEHSSVEIII